MIDLLLFIFYAFLLGGFCVTFALLIRAGHGFWVSVFLAFVIYPLGLVQIFHSAYKESKENA